jgi:hypothetical protein
VAVDERATGRGRASTVTLLFADTGPWWDGEINVELFEAVLNFGCARGPERLLLATMAALADDAGEVRERSTEQLCAAGIADRTYRRARSTLLASGQLELVNGAGGRGNTNVWRVPDPRSSGAVAATSPRRVAPPAGARPLLATAGKGGWDRTLTAGNSPMLTEVSGRKGGHDRTVLPEKCPALTGVSGSKGGQDQTLFELAPVESPAQTPAKTPAETPAANARAGREPLNPRIREDPPNPPEGGYADVGITSSESWTTMRPARLSEIS